MLTTLKYIIISILLISSNISHAINLEISSKVNNKDIVQILDKENLLSETIKSNIYENFKKLNDVNLQILSSGECDYSHCFVLYKNNTTDFLLYKNNTKKEDKIYKINISHDKPKKNYRDNLYNMLSNNINNSVVFSNAISDIIYKNIKNKDSFFNKKLSYVSKSKENNIYSINVSNFDGKLNTTIFNSKAPILSPKISPNGRYLAYTSFEEKVPQIFVIDTKTYERFRISKKFINSSSPSWAQDNNTLFYTEIQNGASRIISNEIQTSTFRNITGNKEYNSNPIWINNNVIYTKTDKNGYSSLFSIDFERKIQKNYLRKTYNTLSSDAGTNSFVYIGNVRGNSTIFKIDTRNNIEKEIAKDRYLESATIDSSDNLIAYSTESMNSNFIQFVDIDGNKLYTLKTNKYHLYEPNLN